MAKRTVLREGFLVPLLCLTTLMLPLFTGAIQAKHFVRFTSASHWNQAREVCSLQDMDLASVNKFSTAYLQQAFSVEPRNGDIWFGLHDAGQTTNSLGSEGFIWINCRGLGVWTNWAQDEPQWRWNNWCVKLLFGQSLQWYPEQCTSHYHFLCEKKRGLCSTFVDALEAGCDVTSSNLTKTADNSTTEENCGNSCVDYNEYLSRCWVYTYNSTLGCLLYTGFNPVYCDGKGSVAGTSGRTVLWVRYCFTISYNDTKLGGSFNNSEYALDGCQIHVNEESTTELTDQTTSLLSASAAVEISSNAPAVPLTQHTTPHGSVWTLSPSSNLSLSAMTTSLVASGPITTLMDTLRNATTATEMQHVTSVDKNSTWSSNTSHELHCKCVCQQAQTNISKPTKSTQELHNELTLNKKKLSATRRQRQSSTDNRPSALATGAVGVGVLVGVMCVIVIPDLYALYRASALHG